MTPPQDGGAGQELCALQYAPLVGKYIRMERPATDQEIALGHPKWTGMECLVHVVVDRPDGVAVVADYGIEYVIRPGERWSFTIWPDEKIRSEFSR